jgi:hypothetical protein
LAAGDTVVLDVTRGRQQAGGDTRPRDVAVASPVRFVVTARNERGFVLAWRTDWEDLGAVLAAAGSGGVADSLAEVVGEMARHELLIQTDELGTPLELVNGAETLALVQRAADRMVASLELDEAQRRSFADIMESMLSPQVILGRAMQDASIYFMFTGGSYETGEEYEFEDVLTNPLGGEPFPALVRFRADPGDVAGKVTMTYTQDTDEAAVRAFLEDFAARLPDGETMRRELSGAELGISTHATYVIDLASGLPDRIDFERRIDLGPGRRVDTLVIETRPRPGR